MNAEKIRNIEVTRMNQLIIAIKGAGEMGSAVAWRLYMANLKKILMMETSNPLAVRREVSFCEAIHDGQKEVEHLRAVRVPRLEGVKHCWQKGEIAVMMDPHWQALKTLKPHVIVDAVLAKKNLGSSMDEAELVIGLGPGFAAGSDVHVVIETNRGHNLGRIITWGKAEPNTGIPGAIGGFAEERVLRAPVDGEFRSVRKIGEHVEKDEIIGWVAGTEVRARIDGVLRGLIRPDNEVTKDLKIGDIDPRGDSDYCYTISDKARAISGSVLEAILRTFNTL